MDNRIMTQEELKNIFLALYPGDLRLRNHIAALTEQRDELLKAAEPFFLMWNDDDEIGASARNAPGHFDMEVEMTVDDFRNLAEAVRKVEEKK